MKITVKIRKTMENAGALKAVASVTFDEMYVVHGVKVVETAKGRFMAMPEETFKNKDGEDVRRDIFHPINAEARANMEAALFAAYDEAVKKVSAETAENGDNN